jgi:acyl carrier protein
MSDQRSRLIACFAAVFPALHEEDIPQATMATVDTWDSVATITLLVVLEEEFDIEIKPEELERLTSFELILDYLRDNTAVPK